MSFVFSVKSNEDIIITTNIMALCICNSGLFMYG